MWIRPIIQLGINTCTKLCTCRTCGRTSEEAVWARVNGWECGDCKSFCDWTMKGTPVERARQKRELHDECSVPDKRVKFVEGTLKPYVKSKSNVTRAS